MDAPPSPRPGLQVGVLLFEGAELLDVTGPAEVFAVAGGGAGYEVRLVARSLEPVRTLGGLRLVPASTFAEGRRFDVLVVPGGDMQNVGVDGVAWLRAAAAEAEVVLGVCMGAFLLARAGLLDGIEATTHAWGRARLAQAVPSCRVRSGPRFVDAGHVVTTAGVTAGIDGALHVVARQQGAAQARWTAEGWLEHPPGPAAGRPAHEPRA